MRQFPVLVGLFVLLLLPWTEVPAMRPIENPDNAYYVVIGTVRAVHMQETKGYRNYTIELTIEQVTKGDGLKKGDSFLASCYQRKKGVDGLEFDSAGHKTVPKEGQRVKVFVKQTGEGIYPDWVDVLSDVSFPRK
jgi:hypothetical protein